VQSVRISDDNPFSDNDAVATTVNVKVRFVAGDNSGGSGLARFCIVRYVFNASQHRFVQSGCSFQSLPAPDAQSGDSFTYTVNQTIPADSGTQYVFVWVKDRAGNISRTPGFDVISFLDPNEINMNRNDVRVFRFTVPNGQRGIVDVQLVSGDVDVSVFQGIAASAPRIAVSAHTGATAEHVVFPNLTGSSVTFQVEVRAAAASRFTMSFQQGPVPAPPLGKSDSAPSKELPADAPYVAGPPALQANVSEPEAIYLPIIASE